MELRVVIGIVWVGMIAWLALTDVAQKHMLFKAEERQKELEEENKKLMELLLLEIYEPFTTEDIDKIIKVAESEKMKWN